MTVSQCELKINLYLGNGRLFLLRIESSRLQLFELPLSGCGLSVVALEGKVTRRNSELGRNTA